MTKRDPAGEIRALRDRIRAADHAYYVLDRPVLSDPEYDGLMRELQALEAAHPDLVTPDSPTRRVSGAPSERFERVVHREPMLSLGNVTTDEELDEFHARIRRLLALPEAPRGWEKRSPPWPRTWTPARTASWSTSASST